MSEQNRTGNRLQTLLPPERIVMLVGKPPLGPDALRQGDRRQPLAFLCQRGWMAIVTEVPLRDNASQSPSSFPPPTHRRHLRPCRRARVRPGRWGVAALMIRLLTMKSRGRLMQSAAMSSPARR
ncbi:Uncharacterised protein [Mycobacteroides abscessus subsp. abscessus]|nr:Uncharacterised protein [Mycobacteroides abscessus subsp. abscessus]